MPWTAHIDGGSRGNPGPAAAGVTLHDDQNKLVFAGGFFLGKMTNNQAEYRGLLIALDLLAQANRKSICIVSDSELLVRQINGQYRVKSADLKPLFDEGRAKIVRFEDWQVRHVMREKNAQADKLANKAMDAKRDVIVSDTLKLASDRVVDAPASAAPKGGVRAVDVHVVRAPEQSGCPAGMRRNQSFTFTTTAPQGICVEACAAVIEAVLALQDPEVEGLADAAPMTPRCGKADCGAVFEVRPGSNTHSSR